MRTTLDLDDRVLAIARQRAAAERTSLGRAVSELALRGFESESRHELEHDDLDLPLYPAVPGHVITSESVAAALDDE